MSSPSSDPDPHRSASSSDESGPSSESIAAFCDAIREKTDWYHKLLDPTRRLDLKWAVEAGFATSDANAKMDVDVAAALEELKDEARRIIFYDFKIPLGAPLVSNAAGNMNLGVLDSDLRASLRYATESPQAVRAPLGLSEEVGVFISDNLVPPALHRELVSHLDALAQMDPPDLHPGSHGKVQDLIHPSLYPFVLGESALNDASKVDARSDTFSTNVLMGDDVAETFASRYAWLPAVFRVADDGRDVSIDPESYINGLGPRSRFPVLYRLIEKVFLLALPHLKETLGFEYEYYESSAVDRWKNRLAVRGTESEPDPVERSVWEKVLARQAGEKAKEKAARDARLQDTEVDPIDRSGFFNSADTSTLDALSMFHGRQFKVIVKAANYCLTAGQTYEGTWHMEGMPHERIVASVIYYYETDPTIIDKGLEFRKFRAPEVDFPTTEEYRHEAFSLRFVREGQGEAADKTAVEEREDEDEEADEDIDDEESNWTKDYPSDWGDNMTTGLDRFIPLGSVPTTNMVDKTASNGTGRILSFPNWIQHKVGKLSVADNIPAGEVAKRKILCFFIVQDAENKPHSYSRSDANSDGNKSDAEDGNTGDAKDGNASDVDPSESFAAEDGDEAGFDPDFVLDDLDPGDTLEEENDDDKEYHGLYLFALQRRVLTTADVSLQMRGTNFRTLRVLLPFICEQLTGRRLPAELVQCVLDAGNWGFSREEAERHRRRLMKDRVVPDQYFSGFSLCEH
ncbi:hypothetical protein B0H19DRAFT_109647 [Mycena capillaripes]|nr:hypothetical protein B0H19DRAFT_109647 [Mycena capillaripes]